MTSTSEMFSTSKISKHLFLQNIRVNGPKALIYCFGLSASRYVEYSAALTFLLGATNTRRVLEVGCGHSILATYWTMQGIGTTVVDINKKALKWQIQKGERCSASGITGVMADARFLPFRNRSFDGASAISSIEHVPYDGDGQAASEMGRVLSDNGICARAVSFSTAEVQKTTTTDDWATGIPTPLRKLFGSSLPVIMNKVGVDRQHQYFERYYSEKDITELIIQPSIRMKTAYS